MKNIKTWLVVALLLLLLGCKEEVAQSGRPAPEIAAVDWQGEPIKLAHWQGRSVFLNFWSVNCGPCLMEMPHLEALSQQYRGKVEVVAINIDPDNVSLQKALAKVKVPITFAILRDSLGMTKERYQVQGTPSSFVIGPDGVLRQAFFGAPPKERLAEVFAQAAQGL